MKEVSGQKTGLIKILGDHVARKIAAGEVIDRPQAVVRELLDNSIDSGAKNITLKLTNGGIDEVLIHDDGEGMSREDLELCWLPHATSKITSEHDLEQLKTLGFRGEALSSLASCSKLGIVSSRNGSVYKLEVSNSKLVELSPGQGPVGTTVSVRDLFFNLPARRRFLKNPGTEGSLCRKIFLEKALAHPELSFKLFYKEQLKTFLPASSLPERVEQARKGSLPRNSLWETRADGQGFTLTILHCRPEVNRRDRKGIEIFTNHRHINEYTLVKAVELAYDPWMPGGVYPYACVFLEIDPSLVDFNIHPAKREVRFRDLPMIRQRLTEVIREKLQDESYTVRSEAPGREDLSNRNLFDPTHSKMGSSASPDSTSYSGSSKLWSKKNYSGDSVKESPIPNKSNPVTASVHKQQSEHFVRAVSMNRNTMAARSVGALKDEPFNYLGQTMGVFLLVECRGVLYIIDQHAAHERILFDRYMAAEILPERLLIPRPLNLERESAMKLELRLERLGELGIIVEKNNQGDWELVSVPSIVKRLEGDIIEFLETGEGDATALKTSLFASLACKAAVRDRSILDDEGAKQLVRDTFALEFPRCPHGRPLWFELSREELFGLVGRT